ncbi:hypothetical protein GCM10027080_09790 [Pedococcus soli]
MVEDGEDGEDGVDVAVAPLDGVTGVRLPLTTGADSSPPALPSLQAPTARASTPVAAARRTRADGTGRSGIPHCARGDRPRHPASPDPPPGGRDGPRVSVGP